MGKDNKNYTIGLDLGVGSVGWAVVGDDNKLIKKQGQKLWGVRLFEPAESAAPRRNKRRQRRTTNKRTWRLHLLRHVLQDFVLKEDPNFYNRLENSSNKPRDGYTLFCGKYTDIKYYREFPTIFHLRAALMDYKKVQEFKKRGLYYRFLYLAASDILKTRGNFLTEGKIDSSQPVSLTNLFEDIEKVVSKVNTLGGTINLSFVNETLNNNLNGKGEFNARKRDTSTIFVKALLGYEFDVNTIIPFGEEAFKVDFESETWDEELTNIDDIDEILVELFRLYSNIRLYKILKDESSVSKVKINIYKNHAIQRKKLKEELKQVDALLGTEYYDEIFVTQNEKVPSYTNYVGKVIEDGVKKRLPKKSSLNELIKRLRKIHEDLVKVYPETTLLKDISDEGYLLLPTNADNRLIPYQIHYNELEAILDNFTKLDEQSNRKEIKSKVLRIMEFKVPYFVGPLSNHQNPESKNYWLVKNKGFEHVNITPFNFDSVVNKVATNEAFITNMLRSCSYLDSEICFQQETILYQTYIFYNTVNKIKVGDSFLTSSQKELLFNNLIKASSLSKTRLINILGLEKNGEVSGFSKDPKPKPIPLSLSAIRRFNTIFPDFKDNPLYQAFYDDVINATSLVDKDEKELVKTKIKEVIESYQNIEVSEAQIEELAAIKSKKWGNLSYRFLNELQFVKDATTGETDTLVNILKNSNLNLMEIINIEGNLKRIDQENHKEFDLSNNENISRYLEEKYISPQARRGIIQAINVVNEIVKIMGYKPSKIAIEFTRENQPDGKETDSRLDKIKEAYKLLEKEFRSSHKKSKEEKNEDYKARIAGMVLNKYDAVKNLNNVDNRNMKRRQIYLYFLQLGKDLYTGKPIDFNKLISKDNTYDIDHIFPQCRIKDDSFDNLVLTEKVINGDKRDNYPFLQIHTPENLNFYAYLKNIGLMSSKKYERLTRKTKLTDEEITAFVNRQKNTLDWINLETARLLTLMYAEPSNAHDFIIYAKSMHTSIFRNKFELLKFRELNNLHHAHDAYLNVVIGKLIKNTMYIIDENKYKTYNYESIIENRMKPFVPYIAKILGYYDLLVTKKTEINNTGPFWNENMKSFGAKGSLDAFIPIKEGSDVTKRGGYHSANTAFFTILRKEGQISINAIPTYHCSYFYRNGKFIKKLFEEYILKLHDNTEILLPMLPIFSKVIINGIPLLVSGKSNDNILLHNTTQTILNNDEHVKYLRKVVRYRASKKWSDITDQNIIDRGFTVAANIEVYNAIKDKIKNPKRYNYRMRFLIEPDLEKSLPFEELSIKVQVDYLNTIITKLIGPNKSNQGELFNKKFVDYAVNQKINDEITVVRESVTGFYTKKIIIK